VAVLREIRLVEDQYNIPKTIRIALENSVGKVVRRTVERKQRKADKERGGQRIRGPSSSYLRPILPCLGWSQGEIRLQVTSEANTGGCSFLTSRQAPGSLSPDLGILRQAFSGTHLALNVSATSDWHQGSFDC